VKTTSLHNQSTSQTPSGSEPTQVLGDPGLTQRIVWTPPNTTSRLTVTSGGGPRPDLRARRDLLRGVTALLLTLLALWRLPHYTHPVKFPSVAPPVVSHLTQQVSPAPIFDPLPPPLYRSRTSSEEPARVFLVAPSVPLTE
jgi:hypothetical protein